MRVRWGFACGVEWGESVQLQPYTLGLQLSRIPTRLINSVIRVRGVRGVVPKRRRWVAASRVGCGQILIPILYIGFVTPNAGTNHYCSNQVHTAVQCMFIVSISCRIPTRADYDLLLAPTAVCAQDLNMGVGICLLVGVNVLLRYSLYCNGVTKKGWGRVPDSGTLSTTFRASPFMHSLLATSALLRGLLLY